MATINARKDQDGITIGWQAIVRKKGQPSQTRTFRSKRDAERWAKSVETEMERGIWQDRSAAEGTTLKECLERYAREVTPQKKSPAQEQSFIRQWQSRTLAAHFMSAIRSKDVADVIRDMENEGKSANTIRLHLALLSHLFTIARTEWGMESLTNPVEFVRKPKLPQGRERRLVGDEEARLLDACGMSTGGARNPWLAPVVIFAIETAMRAGEMLETRGTAEQDGNERPIKTPGLLWENVDLQKRIALLPETKNGTARMVPLSSRAVDVLRNLPRSLDGKVFGTTYEAIHLAYVRACKRAGITGLTFHDLRHEATSRLFEKGLNPMQVAAITGHKTLQMLKRYTHLKAEDLAKLLG
jgi:integrase